MKLLFRNIAVAVASLVIAVPSVQSQNPDLAKDLAEEGVSNEAKIEFVRILHDPTKKAAYAEAHYYLGYLSFKEKNYDRALTHWNLLVKDYSGSPYTEKARDQIRLAYLSLSKQQELAGESIEINNLFDNADFLIGQPLKVSVDTSYLSNGDLAIEWLEEVVAKFPASPDAPRALFREALVYYGWKGYGFTPCRDLKVWDSGTAAVVIDKSKIKNCEQIYILHMVDVLSRLEKQYPDSAFRIPVAFLIGQAYWAAADGKTDANARTYWNKVVDLTQDDKANTYRQIAEKRLK